MYVLPFALPFVCDLCMKGWKMWLPLRGKNPAALCFQNRWFLCYWSHLRAFFHCFILAFVTYKSISLFCPCGWHWQATKVNILIVDWNCLDWLFDRERSNKTKYEKHRLEDLWGEFSRHFPFLISRCKWELSFKSWMLSI